MKRLFVILIFAVFIWISYLAKGVYESGWAIELVGGDRVIDDYSHVPSDDDLFMRSVSLSPSRDDVAMIDKAVLCGDVSLACVERAISKVNIISIVSGDGGASKKVLDAYVGDKGYSGLGCPVKHETSRVISEVAMLLRSKDRERMALSILNRIRTSGGIDYSIGSELCKKYLVDRPYLARAYLYHLSILMNIAYGKTYPGWIYLYYKSGFYRKN